MESESLSEEDAVSREVALEVARTMAGRKAEDILVLEVTNLILITNYFVICSGRNRRQVQGIVDEIEVGLKKRKHKIMGVEGYRQAGWVLMDCSDVIVHVFLKELRDYYDLELHWGDAKRIPYEEQASAG